MTTIRVFAPLALAAGLLVSGCSKPAPAAPTTPPPATPAAAAAPAGDPITAVVLGQVALPVPTGAPASGKWEWVNPDGPGDRTVNFIDKDTYYYSVRLLDCRAPFLKKYADKPADRGELGYCFGDAKPTTKLKGYTLFSPNDHRRVLLDVGHVVVIADIGGLVTKQIKTADLEAFVNSIDLAAIAKLQ